MSQCLFCKIIEGSIPSHTIYEDKNYLAFLDISPLSEGHTLVIPKEHQEYIENYSPEINSGLFTVAHKIINKIKKSSINFEGCNILINNGTAAGQEVPHAHLHIIPRYIGDDIIKTFKKNNFKPSNQKDLAATATKIKLN